MESFVSDFKGMQSWDVYEFHNSMTMSDRISSPRTFPVYNSEILRGFSFITFDYSPDPRSYNLVRHAQQVPEEPETLEPGHTQAIEKMMLLALNQARAGDYEESDGDYEEAENTWRMLLDVHNPRSFFHRQAAKYHLCQVLRKQHKPAAMKDMAWGLQADLRARCTASHPLVINSSMLYIYAIAAQRRICEASGRFRVNKDTLENIRTGPYSDYHESCQEKMKHLESEILYRTQGITAIPVFLRFELDNQIARSWTREKIRTMSTPHRSTEERVMQISNFVEVARADLYKRCHSGFTANDPAIFIARQTLGLLLSMAGQYQLAEQHWHELFACQESTCPGTPRVNISNLAHALNEQGKHEEAEKVTLDAIAHLEACLSKDSPAVLAAWRQIIVAHAKQSLKKEAMLLHHLITVRVENIKYDQWSVFKHDERAAFGELARKLGFGREELMALELHTEDTTSRLLRTAQGLPTVGTQNTGFPGTDEAKILLCELEKSFLETLYSHDD